VAGIAKTIPPVSVDDPWLESATATDAELLVIGWGSTWGVIEAAVREARGAGRRVAAAHLTHLNPFPADLGGVVRRYPRVLVPEMNLGQLAHLLRADYLVDARAFTKIQGVPFKASEVLGAIMAVLDGASRPGLAPSRLGEVSV
jgi:2-oxoglutarate ferredoxin oxidoreductase subunit alpha